MSKKLILVLALVVFFSKFNLAQAGVIINEVKISPIEDRFIKLYNQDNSEVDLTGWYLQRKTQTGASFGSLVSKAYFENKKINAKSYFLISRNLAESDIILDSLTLTESNAIQLKNEAGVVVDKVCWGDIDECGGNNFSNPSPGQSIQVTSQPSTQVTYSNDSNSASANSDETQNTTIIESKTKVVESPTMKVKILTNTPAFTGEPLEIKANISGFSNENVVLGRIFWNFGDGGSFEQINNFEKFHHIYYYPGEYVLFSEYYQNKFSKTPEAVGKIIIKVIPTSVSISKVGDIKDFFIELSNNSGSDIDISGWVINANGKIFIFPKNSVIISKQRMTISSKVTGFTYGDRYNLKLFSGTGELAFNYPSRTKPVKILAANSISNKISESDQSPDSVFSLEPNSASNLQALSIGASNSNGKKQSPYLPLIIPITSFVLIGLGAGSVYFIRQRKIVPDLKIGNDFEILDE